MKLLLDVHHSRLAAERLRHLGHDVEAAADHPGMAMLPDEELLRQAAADGRSVVTENAKDFERIVRSWAATGEHHAGVVFTSPRRFHRARHSYPEDLEAALVLLLNRVPSEQRDWIHWLD